jgi:nucleotide-binding universal stress UspA family protein
MVGLDLSPRSRGAVAFAKLLADRNGDALVGVHVLEEAHLQAALRYHHLAELETAATTAATSFVAGSLGEHPVELAVEVVQGRTAEEALTKAAESHGCDGLVIGRNAQTDETAIIRLGRVARRLLRTVPRIVAVVPPEYDPGKHGGPVVLATGLEEDTAAATFASELATRLGRPLHVVHVAASPEHHSAQYLPEVTLAKLRNDTEETSTRDLAAWITTSGIAGAHPFVHLGPVVPTLLGHAHRHEACAIVTGSRRLTGFERLLIASTGTELAAHAACPVLVVPPA